MKDLIKFLEKEKVLMTAAQKIITNDRPIDGSYVASSISNMRFDESQAPYNQNRDIRGKLFLKPIGEERDKQIKILCDSELIKSIERTMSHDSADCVYVNLNRDGQEYVNDICKKVSMDFNKKPHFEHDSDDHEFLGKLTTTKGMDIDAWYGEKFNEIIIRFGDEPQENMAAEISIARKNDSPHYVGAINMLDAYLDSKIENKHSDLSTSPQFQHDTENDPYQFFLGRVESKDGGNYDAWYAKKFDEIILRFDDKDDAYRAMDVHTIKNVLLNKNNMLADDERLEYKSAIKLLDTSKKNKNSLKL
jgi:hypothetical protein